MWVCLNNAFFSIVRPVGVTGKTLLVRARRSGDIERYFSGAEVWETPGRDYLYRALVPVDLVMQVMADAIETIDYPNFKGSVRDDALHSAYMSVWSSMVAIQPRLPYAPLYDTPGWNGGPYTPPRKAQKGKQKGHSADAADHTKSLYLWPETP